MDAKLRVLAATDIESAVIHYRNEAGTQIALEFVDELVAAIDHLCQRPHTGSLRFAYELEIPGLRSWSLRKFPYLVFYVPDDDRVDIWRVLHVRRDVPALLAPDSPK